MALHDTARAALKNDPTAVAVRFLDDFSHPAGASIYTATRRWVMNLDWPTLDSLVREGTLLGQRHFDQESRSYTHHQARVAVPAGAG
jgi:hypothetical protein